MNQEVRNAVENLEQHGRLKVARVAQGFCPNGLDDDLFLAASGGKTEWFLSDWEAVLASLDNSKLTLNGWLKRQGLLH